MPGKYQLSRSDRTEIWSSMTNGEQEISILSPWSDSGAEDMDLTETSFSTFSESFMSSNYRIEEVFPATLSLDDPPSSCEHEDEPDGVRFDSHIAIGMSASSKEASKDLWYTAEKYREFQNDNLHHLTNLICGKTKQSIQCLKVMKSLIRTARKDSSGNEFSRKQDWLQLQLVKLYQSLPEEALIGLETYVFRCRLKDGRQIRSAMIMKQIKWHASRHLPFDKEKRAEQLSSDCMEVSQPCRLIARQLAEARYPS